MIRSFKCENRHENRTTMLCLEMFHIQRTAHKISTEKWFHLVRLLSLSFFLSFFLIALSFGRDNFILKDSNSLFSPHHRSLWTWKAESMFAQCFCFNTQNAGLKSSTVPVPKPDTLILYVRFDV